MASAVGSIARDAAGRLRLQRVDHRGDGVAGHRPRVAEAEVDVRVSVDVAEGRPRGLVDEERERPGPPTHPVHGYAAEQMLVGLGEQLA